jgi:hypothetical protein
VEYPPGSSPVSRSPIETSSFVDLPVYDVRGDPPATLVIGEEPSATETIGVTYSAEHTVPTTDATALTMPDRHLESLKLFMIWQAIRELELNESQDPDKSPALNVSPNLSRRVNLSSVEDYRPQRGWLFWAVGV